MQRSRSLVVAIAWAVAFFAAPALSARAQPPGEAGGPGAGNDPGNPMTIVFAPAVQTELKLTEAQKTKLYNVAKAVGQKRRDIFQSMLLNGGSPNPQTMMAAQETLRRETDRALGQVLDKGQQERLKQICLRAEGPLAVIHPDVAERLRVNDAQVEAIQGVMLEMQQAGRQMFMQMRAQGAAGGGVDPDQIEAMRLGMSRLRRNAGERIGQVLDRKQKAAFDKMLGAPFDLAKLHQADEGEAPQSKTKADEKAVAKDTPKTEPDDTAKKDMAKQPARKKSRRDRLKGDS